MITSLLDTDLYKYKMLYFIWKMGLHEHIVTYIFKNRSPIRLFDVIDYFTLYRRMEDIIKMRFSYKDVSHLESIGFTDVNFLDYLMKLDMSNVHLGDQESDSFTYSGRYGETILLECLFLSTINEMYCNKVSQLIDNETNDKIKDYRLHESVADISNGSKEKPIKIIEFGTRRRESRERQDKVLEYIKNTNPQNLVGTSNIALAKKHGLKACGTLAHELYSFYAARTDNDKDLLDSTWKLIEDWSQIYPETYYLTDTFGSSWFFENCPFLSRLYGFRQDSGNEDTYMDLVSKDVLTPIQKIMFSNGLTSPKMVELHNRYSNTWDTCNGWGTNATHNSLITPLSIVIKLHQVNGRYAVKLSDNPGKAVGNKLTVDKYKQVFNYNKNITVEKEIIY